MIERKKAPAIHDAVEFDLELKPVKNFTLDNGVPVYAIDAGTQEVLQVEWVFYAGNWYEDENIVAATTNFLIKNGTSIKSAYVINEDLEFYGAYFNRACYNETATLTLHTLSKYLPELLPLVADVVTDAVFPQEELDTYKQNQKQRLTVNLKKSDFVANRFIDEYLFGFQHPYGRYTNAADYDKLQREDLLKFYQEYYMKGKLIMFVAGKLPVDIEYQLNKYFGHLSFNQRTLPVIQHPTVHEKQRVHHITNDVSGVQGSIRLARNFPNRHHPDFQKIQVLNNIFGGYFGSRLMDNIREDKGYTYGIHSYLQNHIEQSAWMVSTEAGKDVCAATISEVYKEMQRLREELIDEDELHLVRNFMIGSILGDLDGPFQIISRWKNYILNGLDESYFYNSINIIKTISAEELQDLAKKYLQPDDFYELLVV
jgi:zinc protease